MSEALSEAVFGDHPYGRPVRGWVETLETMDSARLRRFWESRYEAGSSFLVAAGAVDPEAFVSVVERSFGAWAIAVGSAASLSTALEEAFDIQDRPSVIIVPVDYSENRKLTKRLGKLVAH